MTMRFLSGRARLASVAALLAVAPLAACDDSEPLVPVGLHVTPLSSSSCGDPDNQSANPNPFVDAPNVSIAVRGIDTTTGKFGTLVKKSGKIAEGKSLTIKGVPEGLDREVILYAQGGGQKWYGRDTGIDVTRDGPAAAGMALSRYDGFSCVPSSGIPNVVFPAVVTMGDGRILSFGGFTKFDGDKITVATKQALLFDPRTGTSEVLDGAPVGSQRGAATAVYLPRTNKVVILGGAKELTLDQTKEFPLVLDASRAANNLKDDYLIFDPETKSFTAGVDHMLVGRAFAKTATLGDGTVLVMGGGRWPLDIDGDESHLESDIFDPQDNDEAGGFLDIPSLRGFYPRAGQSLLVLRQTDEGLTQLLVWGGTTPSSGNQPTNLNRLGEVFKQSGRQQDGVNGTFAEVSVVGPNGGVPPDFTFFQELTKLSDTDFIATGGAVMEGTTLHGPRDDEAWHIQVRPDEAVPLLVVTKIGNLSARVFHTAISDDGVHAAILGGWNVNAGNLFGAVSNTVSFFDNSDRSMKVSDSASAQFAPRGGQGATLTPAGTIFMVGGEFDLSAFTAQHALVSEIFTPSFVPLP